MEKVLVTPGIGGQTMSEIKICPFRTYSETRPAVMVGQGDITVTGFMECLKGKCPAWYERDEIIPCTGISHSVEYCRRLE